jgi:hypothetical protein
MLGPMNLALLIVAGVVLLAAIVLAVVFGIRGAIRKRFARLRAELEAEGIVLDSGRCDTTLRFREFRRPGFYRGVGMRSGPGQTVLTKLHLVFVGDPQLPPVPYAELGRFTAEASDGALLLRSDRPMNATGHIEIRIAVDDVDAWVRALHSAGASA